MLGEVRRGRHALLEEVVGDVEQGVLYVLVQLLVGVNLLHQVLEALAVEDLAKMNNVKWCRCYAEPVDSVIPFFFKPGRVVPSN